MTTPVESPNLHLLRLKAKAQETYPEHTYKAVIHRVNRERETAEGRAEMLEEMLAEFERGAG